jgi:hypothetical protein
VGDITLQADENMIHTVVRNLLFNAISNSPAETVITVGCEHWPENGMFRFYLRNFSSPLSADLLAWINSSSELGVDTLRSSIKTKGLGLVICKKLLQLNEGSLYAENLRQRVEIGFTLTGVAAAGEEVKALNGHKKQIRQEVHIGSEHVARIQPLLQQLRGMKVYRASAILSLLGAEDIRSDVSLAEWRKHVEQAVFSADQATFDALVSETYFEEHGNHTDSR